MRVHCFLDTILDNEALTRGLGDAEARALVEWLVEHAEELAQEPDAGAADRAMSQLLRRARGIARFVRLWCLDHDHGAAVQLAATERFTWPWPDRRLDAYDLMESILVWETAQMDELQSWAVARQTAASAG